MTESQETLAIALWWAKKGRNYLAATEPATLRMCQAWHLAAPEERDAIRDELAEAQRKYVLIALSREDIGG